MTVTVWIFTLWTAYSVDIHSFTLQLHLQTNRLLFLTIEQEMLWIYKQSLSELRVLLLLFYCFLAKGYTMDINLYKVKLMQHKKVFVVFKIWFTISKKGKKRKKLCVQYVGCCVYWIKFRCNTTDISTCHFGYPSCRKSAIKTTCNTCLCRSHIKAFLHT